MSVPQDIEKTVHYQVWQLLIRSNYLIELFKCSLAILGFVSLAYQLWREIIYLPIFLFSFGFIYFETIIS
jgi:hypothetical protein